MNLDNIAERLEKRFGLGDQPDRRRRLYRTLERLVLEYGEKAYRIIAEVASDSTHADHPDRWFCKAVVLRLRNAGLPDQEVDDV